jgi:CubicO group peptidase (beta-lactamase class C family)
MQGAGVYIRLPEEIPNSRLATLQKTKTREVIFGLPFRRLLTSMNPRSPMFRALLKPNPGPWVPLDDERIYARNFEVPSGGGVGSARGIARVYSAFATGGHELGLRPETLQALMAPAVPPAHGFRDEGLKCQVQFSLGFFKPTADPPFGRPGAFGSPGSGGAFGFADPELGLAYAYVTNRMGRNVVTDERDIASGPVGVGTRYVAEMKAMGSISPMTIEVTGYEKPVRLASWSHIAGTMDISGSRHVRSNPEREAHVMAVGPGAA